MRTKDKLKLEKIMQSVNDFILNKGYSPSQREIASEVNMATSAVCRYIKELKDNDLLQHDAKGRSYVPTEMRNLVSNCNLVPLYSLDDVNVLCFVEYVVFSKKRYGDAKYFVVYANKNFETHGIKDGDIIIMREQDTANIGQIIIAKTEHVMKITVLTSSVPFVETKENLQIHAVAIKYIREVKLE